MQLSESSRQAHKLAPDGDQMHALIGKEGSITSALSELKPTFTVIAFPLPRKPSLKTYSTTKPDENCTKRSRDFAVLFVG
jgi:hypothetical protein